MKRASSGKAKNTMLSWSMASNNSIPNIETLIKPVNNLTNQLSIWISSDTFNKDTFKFGILIDGRMVYFDEETTQILEKLTPEDPEVFYVIKKQSYKASLEGNQIFQVNDSTEMKREILRNPLEESIKEWHRRFAPSERPGVIVQVHLPVNFPTDPPFVFVKQPRLIPETSHVTRGGSICTEYLTVGDSLTTWNPDSTLENLVEHIVYSCFLDASDLDKAMRVNVNERTPYSYDEARSSYFRQAGEHDWNAV